MVVAWIDRICNFLDKEVHLYHNDPMYTPVVGGRTCRHDEPIVLAPGFSEKVDNFVIPWSGFGELLVDIEHPVKVVVGPHGMSGLQDWLQLYDFKGTAFMERWQELGSRGMLSAFDYSRHVHFTLVLSSHHGDGDYVGDVSLMHFERVDTLGAKALADALSFDWFSAPLAPFGSTVAPSTSSTTASTPSTDGGERDALPDYSKVQHFSMADDDEVLETPREVPNAREPATAGDQFTAPSIFNAWFRSADEWLHSGNKAELRK